MGKEEMHVVSLSGGKDSTAMLLMMLERGMRVDEVLFADTRLEFPEMYDHLKKVEEYTGIPIKVIKSEKTFEYYMFDYVKKKGKRKGQKGYSWPNSVARWCTDVLKRVPINKHYRDLSEQGLDIVEYVGIAFDEKKRMKEGKEYPLVEWEITEEEALQYCYDHGFDWGGLYEKFSRVSCWCCPMQRIHELRTIWKEHPELWQKMREWDSRTYRKFRPHYTFLELEEKFEKEEAGLIKIRSYKK